MERRKEPRYEADQPATLTLLSGDPTAFQAHLINVSGTGMGLLTASPLPVGAAVKIDVAGDVYLGEICFCACTESGRYCCGVQLEHVIANVDRLAAIAAAC